MRRVSRDARLLFVQLWTIVDDEGRAPAEPDDLVQTLYPSDFDTERYMHMWLDELEVEGCIERYDVDGIDYLRVVHWHKHQQISHPTRSRLPPSPGEWPADSGAFRNPSLQNAENAGISVGCAAVLHVSGTFRRKHRRRQPGRGRSRHGAARSAPHSEDG